MTIEIVDFPIKNGASFHCYVKLPEAMVFQGQLIPTSANSQLKELLKHIEVLFDDFALLVGPPFLSPAK